MKATKLILLLCAACVLSAFAESAETDTPEAFAKRYIAAMQSNDIKELEKLLHPKFMQALKPDEAKRFEGRLSWMLQRGHDTLRDPLEIRVEKMTLKPNSLLTWPIVPEFRIEIQPDRELEFGQKPYVSANGVTSYEGKYYLVFPFIKEENL